MSDMLSPRAARRVIASALANREDPTWCANAVVPAREQYGSEPGTACTSGQVGAVDVVRRTSVVSSSPACSRRTASDSYLCCTGPDLAPARQRTISGAKRV
jgi:hypothetical protein